MTFKVAIRGFVLNERRLYTALGVRTRLLRASIQRVN